MGYATKYHNDRVFSSRFSVSYSQPLFLSGRETKKYTLTNFIKDHFFKIVWSLRFFLLCQGSVKKNLLLEVN